MKYFLSSVIFLSLFTVSFANYAKSPNVVRTKFKAEVQVLWKDKDGHTTPFHNKYRPQFLFRTTDVTGEIHLEEGRKMVMPGDNITITVKLKVPVAIKKGLRFKIRDGGRTVGTGQITEIMK